MYSSRRERFPASGAKPMFHQNQNLIVHSGFAVDAHAEKVQFSSEPMAFGYWFWHGGFAVAISYIVIICGTIVFIRHLFSLLKKS